MTVLCPLKAALNKAVDPSYNEKKKQTVNVQTTLGGASHSILLSGLKHSKNNALHVVQHPDRPHARAAPSLSRCDPSEPPSTRGQYRP